MDKMTSFQSDEQESNEFHFYDNRSEEEEDLQWGGKREGACDANSPPLEPSSSIPLPSPVAKRD